jgi:phosphotransferase system enzyme I (PtsI)
VVSGNGEPLALVQQRRNKLASDLTCHEELRLPGASICPGIGIGRVRMVDLDIPIPLDEIDSSMVTAEQDRYSRAVETARRDLPKHVATVHGEPLREEKAIIGIHQAMLADESFHDKVRTRIAAESRRAEFCLYQEATALISAFDGMRDPYFKARGEDVRDMAYNLLTVLSGDTSDVHRPILTDDVLLSRYLHSSHAIMAHRGGAQGFASASKALASHAAILLKGFSIASVGDVAGLLDAAREGDKIIIDGAHGFVIIRPSSRTVREYRARQRAAQTAPLLGKVMDCITADGTQITLRANIEHPDQVDLMLAHGLDGIGLFRTEFMIPPNGRIPSEDEQVTIYRRVFEGAGGRLITFRTFDIGADKKTGLSLGDAGSNPALGVRGIRRHLMSEPAELRTQLRAILRAAAGHPVGILFPMVTTKNEITRTKRVLAEVDGELRQRGAKLPNNVVLGAMIEIPAAAISVQDILAEVDFISLGTNDLLQYFMAADRDNERVVHYNDPTAPAFLWLLRHVINRAAAIGRAADVTVCGEIASNPHMLPHLLKLGYRSFSIASVAAITVRDVCAQSRVQ